MIYIAAPYSHPDEDMVQARMEWVYKLTAELMLKGVHVVNPLSMHEVVVRYNLPDTFDFWDSYCFDLLKRCDSMCILKLEGWQESRGIMHEMNFALENKIPVMMVNDADDFFRQYNEIKKVSPGG